MLCGHTHLRRTLRLSAGTLVVNPGSVGWPAYEDDLPYPHVMEAGTPHARYAIVDDASGQWKVSFHAIDYEWDAAAQIADSRERPAVSRAAHRPRLSEVRNPRDADYGPHCRDGQGHKRTKPRNSGKRLARQGARKGESCTCAKSSAASS
jgi:hypothetical protein